jgi:hypothetical protein
VIRKRRRRSRESSIESAQCRTIHLGVRRKVYGRLLQPRMCTCVYAKTPVPRACQYTWSGFIKLVPVSLPFTQVPIVLSQRIRNNNSWVSLPRSTRFFLPTASLDIATRRQSKQAKGISDDLFQTSNFHLLQRCEDLRLGEKEMMTSCQQGRAISH